MDTSTFFDYYYNRASINSLLIMDMKGKILNVNKSFTKNFGFVNEEIIGKQFSELFTPSEKEESMAENELETVKTNNQANDDGFIVNKEGHPVWCSGESVIAEDKNGNQYIIKDIINLEERKHLNLFLNDSEELLNRIFHFTKDIPMLIIDGAMKVTNINKAFMDYFNIQKHPEAHCSLKNVGHPFWNDREVRNFVCQLVVTNLPLRRKRFIYTTEDNCRKLLSIDSKIFIHPDSSRDIFLIIDEIIDLHNE